MPPKAATLNATNPIYIYDAVRTPRGKGRAPKGERPGGALSSVAPYDLVAGLSHALHDHHSGLDGKVSRLALGCVGQVGPQGGNIALVSRLASGLPETVSTSTINNLCVSGLTAVNQSAAWANAGDDGTFIMAGGVECLSQVPFLADKASFNTDPDVIRRLKWTPPVMGAELVATQEGFTKSDLDDITLMSHLRAANAWKNGKYERGVIPVKRGGATLLDKDECIRSDMTPDRLAAMEPAFAEQGAAGYDAMIVSEFPELTAINHVHSVANCPSLADAAALILLGNKDAGASADLTPKAKIIAYAETASNPIIQFLGGFKAMNQVLEETGLTLADFDRIEFMEAFAATPLKFYRDYKPDMDKVNVNGGHLAMGHPIGATGAVLLTTLVHELDHSDGTLGLVVASGASGIGSAMIIERVG